VGGGGEIKAGEGGLGGLGVPAGGYQGFGAGQGQGGPGAHAGVVVVACFVHIPNRVVILFPSVGNEADRVELA
jgi:hypothetical protein